jgi:hypothetical protein
MMKISFFCVASDIFIGSMMNDTVHLLRDNQQSDKQMMLTSNRKKKCRGNRKEQHARRRLRKRDLNGATTIPRTDTTIETQLRKMNTEMIGEPFDSIHAPIEGITQVSSPRKRGMTDE